MQINLDSVADVMEERGINADDIHQVIEWAEESSEKLTNGESFLAKKRLDRVTVYAEYTRDGDTCTVTDTYSHRVKLAEDE